MIVSFFVQDQMSLRAISDSDISVGTLCVIYNYTFISKIRHTCCPIHIHKFSMIINQTKIELILPKHILNRRARHIEYNNEGFVRMECMTTMYTVL